jgi:hypothetical protein
VFIAMAVSLRVESRVEVRADSDDADESSINTSPYRRPSDRKGQRVQLGQDKGRGRHVWLSWRII